MAAATYFSAGSYGNAVAAYPGNIASPPDGRGSASLGLAAAFIGGMTGPGLFGNLPRPVLARYGGFFPGALPASTLLQAFAVRQGPHPRLAPFANVQFSTDNPPPNGHPVPPYGNGFVFT